MKFSALIVMGLATLAHANFGEGFDAIIRKEELSKMSSQDIASWKFFEGFILKSQELSGVKNEKLDELKFSGTSHMIFKPLE